MNSVRRFDSYLERFRRRLTQLATARGLALLAAAALLVTIAAVATLGRAGFPPDLMLPARLILFSSLAAIAYFFVVRPRRRIRAHGAAAIESRTPAFDCRVETYLSMTPGDSPLRELLAEDSLAVAAVHPPENEVRSSELRYTWSVAGLAAVALLVLGIAGPGNYAFGVRDLWLGWAFPGLLPPQSIEVSPGDGGIRPGGSVRVRAAARGFSPKQAWVHASFGDGEWQRVPMSPSDDGFEFTFFSVREPLEYYVSASDVRSPTYDISVVDVPAVENLALTYHYPQWTGREPETFDPAGDVRTIAETRVELRLVADRPMTPGALIVDDEAIPLDVDGNAASAAFTVVADGKYYVAATLGGERIRLTDDYFITVQDDEAPRIEFRRPGRDWSASRIEEVTARVAAEDDFAIDSLALHYSVNGGAWQVVDLPTEGNAAESDHVFLLESMSADSTSGPLAPGDLVSYYAVARDRDKTARTDMFFIDVQPFDRRYSQSQQAGGGMAGQQGPQQTEISDRQREIIISTWNLIREQSGGRGADEAYIADNAALLSRLQNTLRSQVETLAGRIIARQLAATDDEITRFVENLQKAAEAMAPAAERLGEIELEQALLPAQEALQHLLAAEAVFTDISVSLQANNRGTGGGRAGRDLTELFELEMDLEKNQYETGSSASPDPPQQQLDDTADELAELARRQEQLARNIGRNQSQAPAQRWHQERLRREVEELRKRLNELARSAANQQSEAQGESASLSSSAQGPGESRRQREFEDLERRLESAERAMREADRAMQGSASREELDRALAEAQRQLEGARDRASEARRNSMLESVGELAVRAEDLHAEQAALEDQLQKALRRTLDEPEDAQQPDSGLTADEEQRIAAEKRALQAALQALQQDARRTATELEDNWPRAAQELVDGVRKVQDNEVEARLAVAASYIEQGAAVYVVASESAVTEALRGLRDDLAQVEQTVAGGNAADGAGNDRLRRTLARARELRRDLQRIAENDAETSGFRNRGRDDLQQPTGLRVGDLETVRDFERRSAEVSRDVMEMMRELSNRGVSAREVDELRRLAADVRESNFSGNPELVAREAMAALSLVEQLELALANSARKDVGGVRGSPGDEIPEAYRDNVADYYRRLGQVESRN